MDGLSYEFCSLVFIALYRIALYGIVSYRIVLYRITSHRTVQYSIASITFFFSGNRFFLPPPLFLDSLCNRPFGPLVVMELGLPLSILIIVPIIIFTEDSSLTFEPSEN